MKITEWNGKIILQFFQKNRWAVLVLFAGLLLLLWPSGGSHRETTQTEQSSRIQNYEYDLAVLEKKLTQTLSNIQGAGTTEVVLTLASTGSIELAENRTSKDGTVETGVVVIKNGSNQEEVMEVAQQYPVFLGALVVSEGGRDPQVKLQLLQAVKALTGLSSDQISICERSGGDQT